MEDRVSDKETMILPTAYVVCWSLSKWQGLELVPPPKKLPTNEKTNDTINRVYDIYLYRIGGF